ncbi:4-phosphoerythronate dehydrogenase [Aquirhabdus sp.]|uniref:4-phosphoerythronate dehydrogenase n=1 Tax=Aquirhabdus sp. TaxID=2824160 RepID=UPI00396CEF59
MQIVVDENLSLTDYFFSSFGEVTAYAGRGIHAENLKMADALLVRSVTKVTPKLLQDATALSPTHQSVKFVGSATIGMDHLDVEGLQAMGVIVANAPGCNAQAVAEYVATAILMVQPKRALSDHFTLGIVGLGNVGTRLNRLAKRLGWRVIGVDPFVTHADIEQVTLAEMLPQVDAVSIHVPLTQHSVNATYHLMDEQALALMKPDTILINTARGPVIKEAALLADFNLSQSSGEPIRSVVLDVFEHEPRITNGLLAKLAIATPHIAGYTLEGKARGTEMVYQAFCQWQGIKPQLTLEGMLPSMPELFDQKHSLLEQLPQLLPQISSMHVDDLALRACLKQDNSGELSIDPIDFDRLRRDYPLRREWSSYGDQG